MSPSFSDPTYPLFPIFAFLGFILSLIPLPWHLQAWNSGTCYFMAWTALACLNQFVNSIVWAGNALNPSPIWCDISIRILLGSTVGIPAASLCINRRLYHIATSQSVVTTRAEKRRGILIDTLICVLFPIIFIALQYVVQGHRFNIFEDIGCYPALYNTLLTYFISSMWPIVIGLISATYCVLSLRAFASRRAQFSQFLSSNKSLTVGRYFRLMALAMTEIIFTVPLAIFSIWLNATASPIGPWRSWADTHFAYSRMEQIPSVIWRRNHLLAMEFEFSRWVTPLCAFIFFAFFGFADEAKKNYSLAFWAVAKRVGYTPAAAASSGKHNVSIGQFRKPQVSATDSLPAYYPQTHTVPLHDLKRSPSSTSTITDVPTPKSEAFNSSSSYDGSSTLSTTPTTLCFDSHDNKVDHSES